MLGKLSCTFGALVFFYDTELNKNVPYRENLAWCLLKTLITVTAIKTEDMWQTFFLLPPTWQPWGKGQENWESVSRPLLCGDTLHFWDWLALQR